MYKHLFFITFLFLFSCGNKTTIPFNYNNNERQILLDTKIKDSINAVFCYDTGADVNLIDSLFFASNNIKFNKSYDNKLFGVGEGSSAVKIINDTLIFKVKNFESKSSRNFIYDLKSFTGKYEDGILGIETFYSFLHKIDYQKKKITINPSYKGYQAIPIKYINKKIYLPVYFELYKGNSFHGDFLLDTGAANSSLNSWLYNEELFENVKKTKFYSYRGIGNKKTGYAIKVDKLGISKDTISNHLMAISLNKSGFLAKTDIYGIIGNDVLSKFIFIYDIPNLKIWYKPVKYENKETSLFIGFRAVDRTDINKGWIVKSLQEDSDAVAKGLEFDDQILSINGFSVNKIDYNNYFENTKPNETHFYEVLKSNNEIKKLEITFKVFFE